MARDGFFFMLKFVYSEKATKILRNLSLTFDHSTYSQKLVEDLAKFCGLLRIYELYETFVRQLEIIVEIILQNDLKLPQTCVCEVGINKAHCNQNFPRTVLCSQIWFRAPIQLLKQCMSADRNFVRNCHCTVQEAIWKCCSTILKLYDQRSIFSRV